MSLRLTVIHHLWILLAAGVVFFLNLGGTRLWDQDEAFFARAAVEMHQREDWVVPHFNGQMFGHKPPFMFWAMILGQQMFGHGELAARFFSAVFGLATVVLVYWLARRLFSPAVGLWSALAMSSAVMFSAVSRAATPDAHLVFFITAAMFLFVLLWQKMPVSTNDGPGKSKSGRGDGGSDPWPWLGNSVGGWAAVYAAMGMAALVKGPIGVLLPACSIGLFLMLTAQRRVLPAEATRGRRVTSSLARLGPVSFVRAARRMRPLLGMVVVLLVAGPWFLMVGLRTEGAFLAEFFGIHNFGRFVQPMDSHSGPIFYYLPAVLVGFFPWSIFAFPVAADVWQTLYRGEARSPNVSCLKRRGYLLLLCLVGVVIGFFSLASTKLPNYVLPAFPALAILTGCLVDRWTSSSAIVGKFWPRWCFGWMALIGAALLVGFRLVANWRKGEVSWLESLNVAAEVNAALPALAWIGIAPLVGSIVALVLFELGRRGASVAVAAASFVLFTGSVLGMAALQADRLQTSEALAAAIKKAAPDSAGHLAQWGYFRPSLIYYLGQPIAGCRSVDEARAAILDDNAAVLVATDRSLQALGPLPPEIVVLHETVNFPQRGRVMVLGRVQAVAEKPSQSRKE